MSWISDYVSWAADQPGIAPVVLIGVPAVVLLLVAVKLLLAIGRVVAQLGGSFAAGLRESALGKHDDTS